MRHVRPPYNKICPVCGFNGFIEEPEYDDLCPCCFFGFYVNDVDWSYDTLRADWIKHGAKWAWGNKDIPQPPLWSPDAQLLNIGYEVTDADKQSMGIEEGIINIIISGKEAIGDFSLYASSVGSSRSNILMDLQKTAKSISAQPQFSLEVM